MQFSIITIFPEMFQALDCGVTGRARKENKIHLNLLNPRDFAKDKHLSIDDHPYGGGPGMVMMPEPLQAAIRAAKATTSAPQKTIFLSPQAQVWIPLK